MSTENEKDGVKKDQDLLSDTIDEDETEVLNSPEIKAMSRRLQRKIIRDLQLEPVSFENGLDETIFTIHSLLEDEGQQYVVVSIHGSAAHVGKTTFVGALGKYLTEKNIPFAICSNEYEILEAQIGSLRQLQKNFNSESGVIILEACQSLAASDMKKYEMMKRHWNLVLSNSAQTRGLKVDKIDLQIGIERPDLPFPGTTDTDRGIPIVDLLIMNEKAIDK
jgi:hypothetical protein